MIAIAYLNHRNCEGLTLKMFPTEEEAKTWIIDNMVDNGDIDNWYDDEEDCLYYEAEEIKNALRKCSLKEIVDGQRDGDFAFEMVSSP